ncbi:hypothetical protein [Alienimonas californiensis]|uniref:Uncharacterized protein n=1 Tax=Alienimonas californiensis TaxID=2527989 RepID=A0A517P919_9PLAN|nr:hypothetical protein [Alienimonas californiensis]QDT15869.1 hypothetical protein CA12_19640 [Alienimonas californiensis]
MRRRRPVPPAAFLALLAGLLCVPGAACAAPPEGVMSSEAFLKTRDFWPEWERSGEVFRVEGRVRSVAGGTLRLENVPLTVRPSAGSSLGRAENGVARVEVTGRIASGPSGPFLQSTAVRALSSDAAEFNTRKLALDRDDPAALERLAAWAEGRARFYNDPALARRAREVRRDAFDLRWNAAGETTERPNAAPAGVPPGVWAQLALLDAAPDAAPEGGTDGRPAKLADAERADRVHEALRTWWRAVRDDGNADLAALAGQIRRRLPGAATPPAAGAEPPSAELLAAYDRTPAETFAAADEAARAALARRFFARVERTRIEATAAPDGRNGFAVAKVLDARLPELAELAEEYRERELAWRTGRIPSTSRADAAELADLLTQRGEPARAKEVLRTWLAARERSLRSEGVGGLIRAAEEYRALVGDDAAAVRLLTEAYAAANPDSPEEAAVAGRLRDLGMTRAGGRWRTAAEAAAMPIDPITAAMRDGRVVVGMTAPQVRAALGAPPARTQAVSRLSVAEVWIYAPPAAAFRDGLGAGGSIVVHLSRPKSQPPEEATVTAVHRL